jgi:hypothetical protein
MYIGTFVTFTCPSERGEGPVRYVIENMDTGQTHEAASASECDALLERLSAHDLFESRLRVRAVGPSDATNARPAPEEPSKSSKGTREGVAQDEGAVRSD